ncbi:sugar-binding transcriptional regulator [Demetria terragena]|uniref:sugar-binding transcriptional regulator n=1 Tax=Demetria terragena TaxID=63959 RepID=UPI001B7FDAEB|nr:sugar-binding domain-containing protein [Demetria terragena]
MSTPEPTGPGRFDPLTAYRAARLYYGDNATQADIAKALSVSRPTVSRLLAEARRIGLVSIDIRHPDEVRAAETGVQGELQERLGLRQVYIAPRTQGGAEIEGLRYSVEQALADASLRPGDALLVASGETTYKLTRSGLGVPPGLDIVPTVGGVAEPEAWHQANETVRSFAELAYGRARPIFATAMPTEAMIRTLREDPGFRSITALWDAATVALVGVGAPPGARSSISTYVPTHADELRRSVGDVCLNFFDVDGQAIEFEGSDRMVRISADQLRAVPTTIAAAVGAAKAVSIIGAAKAGLLDVLVTDSATASAISEQLDRWSR